MKVDEFFRLIHRITYKPGFQITAWHSELQPGINVRFSYLVDDVENPEVKTPLRMNNLISYKLLESFTEEDAIEHMDMLLARIEQHERNEWFKVDGVCVTEPHPELKYKNSHNNTTLQRRKL